MQRFWDKVKISSSDDCWPWTSHLLPQGYGTFWLNGKTERAHRVSWALENGQIPTGMCVLHKCDNRQCVNPHHLFLGTQADNAKDRDSKGRGIFPNGERAGNSKLTEAEVIEIRSKYVVRSSSLGQSSLARIYGVSQPEISCILLGKTWKHLLT